MEETNAVNTRCVGSTGNDYRCSVRDTLRREAPKRSESVEGGQAFSDGHSMHEESNFFKSAQWTPDGTCVVTNSEDNHLRTFVLPSDLLEPDASHALTPYSTIPSGEPVYSISIYPGFNLQDPSTSLLLSTTRDHPIRLSSALYPCLLASYPLISPTTEAYITPHSTLFTPDGKHFVTGSDSLICTFDVSRPGEGPTTRLPTIPSKRKKIVGGGVGMKGIVSALDLSSTGVLATGTFTRSVGLYDSAGQGDCIAVFSVAEGHEQPSGVETDIGGSGITQVRWSPCARYLYVAERKSDGILIYDIRVAGKKLGCLKGRRADTNQRLGVDVVPTESGHEIWAGGTDGGVRIWANPWEVDGVRGPSWGWEAHDDPVTSAVVHISGTVVATCSGQRYAGRWWDEGWESEGDDSDGSSSSSCASFQPSSVGSKRVYDNRLMVWAL